MKKIILYIVCLFFFSINSYALEDIPEATLKANTFYALKQQIKVALKERYENFEIIYTGNIGILNILSSSWSPHVEDYHSPTLRNAMYDLYPITEYEHHTIKHTWNSIKYHSADEHHYDNHIHIMIGVNYFMNKVQQIEAEKKLVELIQIIEPQLKDKNEYDKVVILHEIVVRQISYVKNDNTCYSIYGAVVENKAVCMGYGLLFQRLCDYFKIPCKIVVGDVLLSKRDARHMWNMVKVYSQWYHIDTTWDDSKDKLTYDFFLVSDKFMRSKEAGVRIWDSPKLYQPCLSNY